MLYIVKFGKEAITGVPFSDNKQARAWADENFPERPACSVVGVPA